VDRRGAVKILDLGIVRFTQDANSRVHGCDVILGTLDYLAPEQAEDSSAVDPRADLYALGATLYFLLAGHPPFPVADLRRKLAAKRAEDPPPIHRLRPDVPDGFSAVVQRLLARNPADRYALPAAAVAALRPWAAHGPDFPARLFRPSSDSTAHDRPPADGPPDGDPMPETLRIVKPLARPAPADPPPPTEPIFDPDGADTDSLSTDGAPTDEELAVPGDPFDLLDSAGPVARLDRPVPARPPAPAGRRLGRRVALGLGLAALALLGALAGLVRLAAR
jgi:serine/threonine protein kinase